MSFHSVIYNIWLFGTALEVLLVGVLLIRKTWMKFPLFTTYASFNLLVTALAYAVSKNGLLYFYFYWISEAIAIILGLAVVYEIFKALFSQHEALRKIARLVFSGAIVFLVLLGTVVAVSQPSVEKASISRVVMIAAEAARIVEIGLLMFLFLFSTAFGLHWRAHVFGVALGLGVFVAVDLVNVTLRSYFGTGAANVLNLARTSAFCLSLLMWTAYLFVPERAGSAGEVPERAQLEQWNQAVMELINR
jgi:hypothetical protein